MTTFRLSNSGAEIDEAIENALDPQGSAQLLQNFDGLQQSTGAAKGAGTIWRAGAAEYEEAAAGATDQHITTAGGVKLYEAGPVFSTRARALAWWGRRTAASDDVADGTVISWPGGSLTAETGATLVSDFQGWTSNEFGLSEMGASETTDPTARAVFAPALVTALSTYQQRGCTLKKLLGTRYDGSVSASTAFNTFVPELAGQDIAVTDPDNMTVLFDSPIRPVTNMKLYLGANTKLLRGFAAAGPVSALISPAASEKTDGVEIHGGILQPVDSAQTGVLIFMHGDEFILKGVKLLDFRGGQGVMWAGDYGQFDGCVAWSPDAEEVGTGAFRMLAGTGFTGTNCRASAGDDLFQFVPATSSSSPFFSQDISKSYWMNCYGEAQNARVCLAAVAGQQDENLSESRITDVGFYAIRGSSNGRVMNVENTEGTGNIDRQVDRVTFSDIRITATEIGPSVSQAGYISTKGQTADLLNGIGSVVMSNVSIIGVKRDIGLHIDARGCEVVLNDCEIEGEERAILHNDGEKLTINGGRFGLVDQGGGGAPIAGIDLLSTENSRVEIKGRPEVYGVPSSVSGVRNLSATTDLHVDSLMVTRRTSATSVTGIQSTPDFNLHNVVEGDYDTETSGAGRAMHNSRIGNGPDIEVQTDGSLIPTHPFQEVIPNSGDSTASVTSITVPAWARPGQYFTFARGAESTITFVTGSNIVSTGSVVLDGNKDSITFLLRSNGTFLDVNQSNL